MCTLAQVESLVDSKIKVHLERQNAQISEQVAFSPTTTTKKSKPRAF